MVKLENRENAMRTYNLDHRGVCIKSGTCRCSKTILKVPVKMGAESGVKDVPKRLAASITFLAHETRPVDDHVLLAAEVQAAIKSGKLRQLK